MSKQKIAICGEAFGAQEEIYKKPFVGAAGDLLTTMLGEAEILTGPREQWAKERNEKCFITNVFNFRPTNNDIETLTCRKKDLPREYDLPPIKQGHYIRPEFLPEIERLKSELEALQPNIVIALGNTACWALLRRTGIDKLRGAITRSALVPGLKVIPAYHPAAVLRMYHRRPMTVMDLAKAGEASHTKEITRVAREIWLDPTIDDLLEFERRYIDPAHLIAFDIENPGDHAEGQISCIGFAPDPYHAIVVPFFDPRKPMYCYWQTRAEEVAAWLWVRKILANSKQKVGQNGLYDIQHLALVGVRVANYAHDTMLLHHSLQPEEKKGLDVLGSFYANEDAWKTTLTQRGKKKSIKRDN
jgi:uracil-DNA glycosylase